MTVPVKLVSCSQPSETRNSHWEFTRFLTEVLNISSEIQAPSASGMHPYAHSDSAQQHTLTHVPGLFNPTKGIRYKEAEQLLVERVGVGVGVGGH